LPALEKVAAVVLDLGNDADVDLVAAEIKRCRPQVPTILVAEQTAPRNLAHEPADALVLKSDQVNLLVTRLEAVPAAGARTPAKAC
jgi:hypothetical protein